MSTWEERTDHLADHYKSGATMANWHGDWGFDDATSNMVESAIPPCKYLNVTFLGDVLIY